MSFKFEKIHSALFFECLLYSMIIISLPYSKSGTPFLRDVGKILFVILFFYLIAVRWRFYKNSRLSKFNLRLGFDEYIIIGISILGVILWVFNMEIGFKGVAKPFLFMAVYLCISSCAKMIKVNEKLLVRILVFYISVILIHSIAEYIYSSRLLLDYLSGIIPYKRYALNSWNMLYTNYNFFAKNLMVGFICSLSLYLLFLVKKANIYAKYILFFLACFFCVTTFMMYSRAPVLAIVIYIMLVIPCFLIITRMKLCEYFTLKDMIFILSLCSFFIFLLLHFDFLSSLMEKTEMRGSNHRFGMWIDFINAQIQLFPQMEFFTGHGYNNTNTDFYKIWEHVTAKHVHNNFFFIWYNYGFISMVLFIFLLIRIWFLNFKIFNKIWFIYFIPLSYMGVIMFESYITRMNTRFDVIFFFIFLILPYNMYLQEYKSDSK